MPTQGEFFRAVLPAAGIYCIAVKRPDQEHWAHIKCDTPEQLAARLKALRYTEANYYFAISTFEKATVLVGGKERFRTQTNALYTRSLVLDIDVKPGHEKYCQTKEDGLADLEVAIAALRLPRPIVVDSGGGYHVYWPLAAAVPSKEWAAYARAFLTALELSAPRLVADRTRVADTAGILRIPDSYNLKFTPPEPVRIVEWSDENVTLDHLRNVLPALGGSDTPLVTLAQIPREETPPVELRTTARNCNWLREYMKAPASATEPEWYAILGLAPYMTHTHEGKQYNGEDIAQLLSRGHPSYSSDATSIKFAQVKIAQTGPTTCARLQGLNASRCAGCPFAGSVKSPAQTGRLDRPATEPVTLTTATKDEAGNSAVETVTIPLPPKPYFRGQHGGVYVKVRMPGDDGAPPTEHIECIYDYDLYPLKRYRTEILEAEQLELHCWLPKDGLRKMRMPTELLADHKKLNIFLSGRGVVAKQGSAQRVTKYMIDYARHLQQQESADVEFARFGWRDVGTANPKFVVADGVYSVDGSLTTAVFAPFLKDASAAVSCDGSLEEWKRGFDIYTRVPDTEAFQVTALLGFAAPLLALTEYSGVYYNMVGDSAAGKSTALKVMTSVWGKPRETHIGKSDTQIAMYNFISYLSSIPVAFDEVTKMDGDALSDFLLTFTGGRGKMRAQRDGQNTTNGNKWDTIVCGTANNSIHQKLADSRTGYSAESMRVFEVFVPASHPEYKIAVDEAMKILRDNYGHAGREFIKYVLPRIAQIKNMLEAATIKIIQNGQLRNQERFWAAMLACVQIGGLITKNILKLHSYDMDRLMDWAMRKAIESRENVIATMSDSGTILGEFFNANIDALVRINNGVVDLGVDTLKPRQIKVRIESDGGKPKRAYISAACIRAYCLSNKIDFAWLRRELQTSGILTNSGLNKRLASGTNLIDTPIRVWEVDMEAAGVPPPEERAP